MLSAICRVDFFFSSRRRHTRLQGDWSSDVCSSDLWGGRTVALFAHRRLREKPPAGGVSVYRESIPLDERLVGPGLRLLDALGWRGVRSEERRVGKEGRSRWSPYH